MQVPRDINKRVLSVEADIYPIVGLAGFLMSLASYGRLRLNRLDGNSSTYAALNLGASSMVALSLLSEFNLASLLIQTWIIISLFGLGRHPPEAHRKRPGALPTIQLLNDQ